VVPPGYIIRDKSGETTVQVLAYSKTAAGYQESYPYLIPYMHGHTGKGILDGGLPWDVSAVNHLKQLINYITYVKKTSKPDA
jgi:hypothetical protein